MPQELTLGIVVAEYYRPDAFLVIHLAALKKYDRYD